MKKRSPLRIAVIALIMLILIYVGYVGAVSLITGEPMKFGFSSSFSASEQIEDFVVAGIDEDGTRTDLILFCRYNRADNSLNVIQIPRDTKVENKRRDKKINSAYGSSEDHKAMFQEIESIIGIRPRKSIIVSFDAFRKIIDAIGGVEVDVPIRMLYNDPAQNLRIDLLPGRQLLDGRKAEMFMRFRKNDDGTGYPNGDIDRVAAQRKFYEAAAKKVFDGATILKIPQILGIISESVKTDFTVKEIVRYVGDVPKLSMDKINIYTLPGEGGYDTDGISYFFHDKEKTKEIIEEHFAFEKTEIENEYKGSIKNRFIKVRIIDATGVSGEKMDISATVEEMLKDYGFKVVAKEKADTALNESMLINHNEKRAAIEVQKIFKTAKIAETVEKYVLKDGEKEADVTLKIGTDFNF